jgi:catechol 2,3-dioxygenase-like lactoylglutathione lyase family enzyme
MTTKTNYPKAFSHIGITVPNIKEAVKFYSEVMAGTLLWNHPQSKKEKKRLLVKCALTFW